MTLPSPQSSAQTLGVEESPRVQTQPDSTEHAELHPSPFDFPPSSQYPAVGFITAPLPQLSVHEDWVVESPSVQFQPDSSAHEESQPSPLFLFPSSQYPDVGLITVPSPHVSVHWLAVVASPVVHSHPDSI
mmetsp:Transcript_9282/g.8939  ORF Transcript_9282/g.8939 Transcript_9282/m.8939 type:complete len:131 (-) Transcript_9282:217-609(-)